MNTRLINLLPAVFWLLGLGFVVLAITAGIRNYSPVPFGDMWLGYLSFFKTSVEQGLQPWWEQHNEHRIILSRLLFWFHLAVLKGQTSFLQVINYLLAFCLWIALCAQAGAHMKAIGEPQLTRYLAPLLLIPCFSLIQYENFYWGFQSQFFLVFLLPLCAFYFLSESSKTETSSHAWFWFACVLGVLSAGTMANGVLALPIMLLQGMLLRIKAWRLVILMLLASATCGAYFWDYQAIARHGSLGSALVERPIDLLHYVMLYLGAPAYHLMGKSQSLALAMGIWVMASSVFFLWRVLADRLPANPAVALLAMLLFIGGTALGTGGGRLQFGLEQALSYRYTTPALLA